MAEGGAEYEYRVARLLLTCQVVMLAVAMVVVRVGLIIYDGITAYTVRRE